MQNEHKTYYDILKVSPSATDEEIKEAYHELSKIFHPDHNPKQIQLAKKHFQKINTAFEQIKTLEKRKAYNRKMEMAAQNGIQDGHHNTSQSGAVTTLEANNDNQGGLFSQIAEIFWPQNTNKN